MSKREYFLRYSLILKKLQRTTASFQDISNYLLRESELLDVDLTISKRTFQRDITEIRDIFRVDIQYDASRKVYFIVDDQKPDITSRMLEAFDMFNALNLTNDFESFVHFEKRKPQGADHFYGLLHGIKNHFLIRFNYLKYYEGEISKREVEPYALKEFKSRWYLLAKDLKDEKTKTFGLDRIAELEIGKKRFEWPLDFNVNVLFRNSFGIINPTDGKCEEVTLSFDAFQGKYIKSFPLHHTQQVLEDNADETIIKLSVNITYDFIMELLSDGDRVKIISPPSLKKSICENYAKALKQYV